MQDAFGRKVDYLRISVTDRCNLRCIYCMPKEGITWIPSAEILRYEEIATLAKIMAELGVTKVRITGGEPLLRADLPDLVRMIKAIPSIDEVALSTNGVLLAGQARALAGAGLARVNVSLDTLRPDRFLEIAGRPGLKKVFSGIEQAEAWGLTPIKINVVVIKGKNDDELEAFARLTLKCNWVVRFIEVMPVTSQILGLDAFISCHQMLERLKDLGPLEPVAFQGGNGPARYFRLPGGKGCVGVISPLSHSFCDRCNRVRLTAAGRLLPCLFGQEAVDLKGPLRQGASLEELKEVILRAITIKPQRHYLVEEGHPCAAVAAMSQVGG